LYRYVLVPALALATFAFSVAPAFAVKNRVLEGSFGPDGTAATAFELPAAIGVDQSTGQIYVEDTKANTVQRFNSAHEPEPFTGIAPNIKLGKLTGFSFAPLVPNNQLAVDSTEGLPASNDFYVVNQAPMSLRAYQSDGEPAIFTRGPGAGTNEIGGFSKLCGVAVDSNGDIYAIDYFNGIQIYGPSGEHITTITFPNVYGESAPSFCNAAVDSHGTLYLSHYTLIEEGVEKFTPSEFPVTASTTYNSGGRGVVVDPNHSRGVAVDPATNNVFVDEATRVAEYEETGTLVHRFGALTFSEGIAVNGVSGRVYVSDAKGERQVEVFLATPLDVVTGEATEIGATSVTLNGSVNPEGVEVTDCHFDYGTSTAYGQSAACEQTVGSGSGAVAVTAKIKGLTPGTAYHFRLQASNKNGATLGNDAPFSTLPPPAIAGASVANLTASSVDLNAQVNPGGLETTYHVEYGTTTGYGAIVPAPPLSEPDIGRGSGYVAVTQHIEGLAANTTYHWRVVAHNEAGTTMSPDHTFVYQTTGEGLPDGRAYEMVTPPQKNGALVGHVFFGPEVDISEAGSRVIAPADQCFAASESCTGFRSATAGDEFAFTRTGEGQSCGSRPPCWVASALAPPATRFSENNGWKKVSADVGTALFSMPSGPALEEEWYARNPGGSFLLIGPMDPPGKNGTNESRGPGHATANLSHLVWTQTPGAWLWPFDMTKEGGSLYEYVGTGNRQPFLVGVSTKGQPKGSAEPDLISTCGTEVAGNWNALSADGRTIFFTALSGQTKGIRVPCPSGSGANKGIPVPASELYARVDGELEDAHTVAVSQPECKEVKCKEAEASPSDAQFVSASADGSKAFFLDTQMLTDVATEGTGSAVGGLCIETKSECNLYLYDFGRPAGENLIDVSAGDSSGLGPRVQGVVATSADGSHVYFVAKGVLAGRNAAGAEPVAGAENLYVYERDGAHPAGHTALIASLLASDSENWEGSFLVNVTPDGRFLVFSSHGALTRDDVRGDDAAQIFRYDAASEELVRVSVGNDGFNDNGNAGVGNATIVPAGATVEHAGPARGDPTMSDDGSYVFFQSPVALTPHALNDVVAGHEALRGKTIYAQNVYEWHAGHVYLISDGHDVGTALTGCTGRIGEKQQSEKSESFESDVCLLGAGASGSDVFFTTGDRLVPEDTDTQVDIYDARVCEPASGNPCVAPEPPQLPPCGGEACHGIPAQIPSLLAPGTASFNGEGNIVPPPPAVTRKTVKCERGFVKRHNRCVRHGKSKRAKRARRATNHRRAKS
jgi:hypothetical protein